MSKKENLEQDIDLNKYDDQSGVSLKEMDFGLWLAENRQKFLKLLTGILIALCAFFFIYSTYNLIIYYLSGDPNMDLLIDNTPTSPRQLTTDLEISPLEAFAGENNYDLAIKLNNPNDKFLATFDYCFALADTDLNCGTSFILPNEEKYILNLGQTLDGNSNQLSFKINAIFWQRVNSHDIPDWAAYRQERLNFIVNNLDFSSGQANSLSSKLSLSDLEFSIDNSTPYGYYEVPLNILLYNGENLVGVNRYILKNFLSGSKRDIKMSWTGSLPNVNRVEVQPDLNIVDENVYAKYQGETRK